MGLLLMLCPTTGDPSSISEWYNPASACDLGTSVQSSSVTQSCLTLCDPMEWSSPGLPVHHQLPELTQTHVYRVGDAIQPSHPLSSPYPSPSIFPSIRSFPMSQVFASSDQSMQFQPQHQSFQRIFRTDFL